MSQTKAKASGRPKHGHIPQCSIRGPCLATRIRKTDAEYSGCRNCAKPFSHISLDTWIYNKSTSQQPLVGKSHVDKLSELQASLSNCNQPNPFTTMTTWTLLHVFAILNPQLDINTHFLHTPTIQLYQTYVQNNAIYLLDYIYSQYKLVATIQSSFEKSAYCIQDFIYCTRHITSPSYYQLHSLLRTNNFEKARTQIHKYEESSGTKFVQARRMFNGFVKDYNQR